MAEKGKKEFKMEWLYYIFWIQGVLDIKIEELGIGGFQLGPAKPSLLVYFFIVDNFSIFSNYVYTKFIYKKLKFFSSLTFHHVFYSEGEGKL